MSPGPGTEARGAGKEGGEQEQDRQGGVHDGGRGDRREKADGAAGLQWWARARETNLAPKGECESLISIFNVPWHRRMQTAAVASFVYSLPVSFGCLWASLTLMFTPLINVFMAAYLVHIFRDKSPTTGAKKSDWFRRLSWWKNFSEYFPVSLIPTAELDPEQKYIFGYHPHGIICIGAIAAFGTEGVSFSDLFKGINVHLVTLPVNFRVPFLREVWLRLGICDSSKETFRNILSRGSGSAIALVVGGANESLSAEPGTMGDLTLCNRRGFVRQALLYDARLVPVLGFGETDVFAVAKWPALRRLQEKLQRTMGFAMPIFHGRGIFQKAFGLLPFRKPIHVVVGRPINLREIDSRAQEAQEKGEKWLTQDDEGKMLVERCHAAYVKVILEAPPGR